MGIDPGTAALVAAGLGALTTGAGTALQIQNANEQRAAQERQNLDTALATETAARQRRAVADAEAQRQLGVENASRRSFADSLSRYAPDQIAGDTRSNTDAITAQTQAVLPDRTGAYLPGAGGPGVPREIATEYDRAAGAASGEVRRRAAAKALADAFGRTLSDNAAGLGRSSDAIAAGAGLARGSQSAASIEMENAANVGIPGRVLPGGTAIGDALAGAGGLVLNQSSQAGDWVKRLGSLFGGSGVNSGGFFGSAAKSFY